ncbi:MAG TPA: alpha/beta hydrolase [Cyclobacteriaceae bacterium]|nr:alpha/beta hydrolase [Cyclobacteriaceae bacterium]
MTFKSTVLILPGLGNSGEGHWQTRWEKQFPEFIRVHQRDWNTPTCEDWITVLDKEVLRHHLRNVILVGHSLACATIAFWSRNFERKIKGALLVAPSDTEAQTYPMGTKGFSPMPLNKIPCPTITVASTNDYYVTLDRAKFFASAWGSRLEVIGDAGHVNVASGFGEWNEGLSWLKMLDEN